MPEALAPAPAAAPVAPSTPALEPLADPFAHLDTDSPKPKAPEPKPAAPAAPKEPAKTPEKPAVEKAPLDKAPAVDAKAPEVPVEKMAPKALREAYDRLKQDMKREREERTREIEELRKSNAPIADPEKLELAKKYEEMEKRFKAHEEELRYIDYEKSAEFKEKYYEPYQKVWEQIYGELNDYKVTTPEGAERAPTSDDIWAVVKAPSQPEARRIAKELFGEDDANDIVAMRAKVVEANRAMQAAKADYRKNGAERAAQMQRQQEQFQAQVKDRWSKLNKDGVEKHPEWFKAEEGDEKGAQLLEDGFKLADLAWGEDTKLDFEKLLALRSTQRNQAAAFHYLTHKLSTSKERIAALEKELAEFKTSTPGKGAPAGDKPAEDALADPFAKYDR